MLMEKKKFVLSESKIAYQSKIDRNHDDNEFNVNNYHYYNKQDNEKDCGDNNVERQRGRH